MKKYFTPDNVGSDEEPGFDVGEFGFISTETKECGKRKKKRSESANNPTSVQRRRTYSPSKDDE